MAEPKALRRGDETNGSLLYNVRLLIASRHHDALGHIMRAVDCVLAWRNDPYFVPTPTDIARLGNVCAAFVYASAIAGHLKHELESRLAGNSDELQRFRERYGE